MNLSIVLVPYAAILGLLGAFLTSNVIINRVKGKVDAGDGGLPVLAQAIRAHCNFTEQAPISLIVIFAAEAAGARPVLIHVLGAGLVVSRLASATALTRSLGNSSLRVLGGGLGEVVLIGASIAALLALAGVR